MEEQPPRRGLSKEAWAAVGVIGAAVITGIVALLTHLITPTQPPSAQPPGTPLTTSSASSTTTSAPEATTSVIDAVVGKWAGTAKYGNGDTFEVALEVTEACALGQSCGSIAVSGGPCHGEIFLESVDNGEVEFRVDNFAKGDSDACQPGAGERFRPGPGDGLSYRTTYDPRAKGVLQRA